MSEVLGERMARLETKVADILKRLERAETRQDWLRLWASSIVGGGSVLGFLIHQLGGLRAFLQ